MEPVAALAAALEDSNLPLATWTWQGPDRARITSTLSPEQWVFAQVSYHRGWTASVNGEARAIRRDGLGLMIIEPNCAGSCEILLEYDGGLEMLLARIASGLSLLGGLVWFLVAAKRG
jgi:hypothetical protein